MVRAVREKEMPMIAPCGLDCSRCLAYLAWKDDDQAKREYTARLWSVAFAMRFSAADINCSGCGSQESPKLDNCYECGIRACAGKRGLSYCSECNSYSCNDLFCFLVKNPEAWKNLEAIKKGDRAFEK
jgi:hypothetical protein